MRTEAQNRKGKYCAYLLNYVQLLREVTQTENKDKSKKKNEMRTNKTTIRTRTSTSTKKAEFKNPRSTVIYVKYLTVQI